MKSVFQRLTLAISCALATLAAIAQTPDDVLRSADTCSVPLSVLRQRLDAV